MKTRALILLLTLSPLAALLAQTRRPDPDIITRGPFADEWYAMANQHRVNAPISAKTALHPTDPQVFPPGMLDTLIRYDWVYVGRHQYADNSWFEPLKAPTHQLTALRFFPDASSCEYGVSLGYGERPSKMKWNTATQQGPSRICQRWGYTWLLHGEGFVEKARLVSYRDGVLILDHARGDERPGDVHCTLRYRCVLVAVPKAF